MLTVVLVLPRCLSASFLLGWKEGALNTHSQPALENTLLYNQIKPVALGGGGDLHHHLQPDPPPEMATPHPSKQDKKAGWGSNLAGMGALPLPRHLVWLHLLHFPKSGPD